MNMEKKIINTNYTKGRGEKKVGFIVIHTYGWVGASLYDWFNNSEQTPQRKGGKGVSAHYAVLKSGKIEQYVEEWDTAHHAGVEGNNLASIGIEHQDDGNFMDAVRTDELYESSAQLVASICVRYGIACNESGIKLHRDLIGQGGDPKRCPSALNVPRIVKRANEILTAKAEKAAEAIKPVIESAKPIAEIIEREKIKEMIENQTVEIEAMRNIIRTIQRAAITTPTTRKTIGEHLKTAGSYAAPVQMVTTAFGVIFSYQNPEMPPEVTLSYSGLFGFFFNLAYVATVKIFHKMT